MPRALARRAGQAGAVAQNALEVVLLGGLETGDEPAPFRVVSDQRIYRLRHYFPDTAGDGGPEERPVVLLVPPMMLATEVYDVSPQASAVSELHRLGIDPWVVDFGAPEREEGGLERTLTDHVLAVDDAIARVRAATGRDVHLAGYSQGGMFCYQAAAYRRSQDVASIIAFGSPVDFSATLPLGIPEQLAGPLANLLADVFATRALPAWASSTAFRMLDPIKDVRQRIEFLMQLGDREALLPRERQRRFLQGEGFVAWSGPILAEVLRNFVVHNRMLSGGFVIEERLVTLADITCPVLAFVGEYDQIAMPEAVRAITRAAPRAAVYERGVKAGHFGMVVGTAAAAESWPAVLGWTRWVEDGADPASPPPGAQPMAHELTPAAASPSVGASLELAANAGVGALRSLARRVRSSSRGVRSVAGEAIAQLPRLFRLEQIEASTRISLGRLLDEQAARAPDDVLFLFEDRAHTHAAAKHRIDSIVRGLISVGVRQGQHVGVLMGPRPSGLSSVAALSRLGAVSVLMRPDGDHRREAALGAVDVVLTDPEHGARLADEIDVPVLVLGGGADPRDLGPGVIDLERIDPDTVELPGWYRPNPGRAADLGFVVFSGEGAELRAKRITNHRWALSAFGTATAGALSPSDTVYVVTPLHHPAGLMTALGGAVAGGSRIALARRFDTSTFWEEVRRYGVTTVAYTWTLLRALTEAPVDPAEQHHPVRQFVGSGMPRGLWLRVLERFGAPDRSTRVLEFYASTEGDAVLVNVSGTRPGAKGRRLPGSAQVRLAAWDPEAGRLVEGPDGFVLPAADGEIGMLLSKVRSAVEVAPGTPLRGVFAPGDAWHVTGDLFRTDEHGDWWLVDHAQAAIRTARGMVYAFPVQDAFGDLPAVDLSVVYPVDRAADADGAPRPPVAVAAVTLRAGHELTANDVTAALETLAPEHRPEIVHIVDEIPLTTWYRPTTGPLRAAGLPRIRRPVRAWALDAERGRYVPLTAARRDALRRG